MIPIYRAGWQLTKVRAVMLLSLVSAAACLWWGVDIAQTYGLSPGDGGVLAPLWQRLTWAAVVVLLGGAFAAGMWVFGRCYAARIELDPDKQQIHLYTVRFIGSRRHVLDVADVGARKHHAGRFHGDSDVNAPWLSVRLAGWRLPLIIDGQGVVLNESLMKTYFGR